MLPVCQRTLSSQEWTSKSWTTIKVINIGIAKTYIFLAVKRLQLFIFNLLSTDTAQPVTCGIRRIKWRP